MFDKRFKDEMSNIKATDESKARLIQKIENEQENFALPQARKGSKIRWASSLAAVIALVIISVSAFGPSLFSKNNLANEKGKETEQTTDTIMNNGIEFPVIRHQRGIPANVTHGQVYNLFSAIYQLEASGYYDTDGSYELLEDAEDYVVDEFGDDVAVKNENLTATGDASPDGTKGGMGGDSKEDHSTTNTQVENVDEADIVKTDGRYIYTLRSKELKVSISKAEKGKLSSVSSIDLYSSGAEDEKVLEKYYSVSEMDMYLYSNRLVIIFEDYAKEKNSVIIKVFDLSKPEKPALVRELSQSGRYLSSRVIDDKLYVFTNEYFYQDPVRDEKSTYLPCTSVDGAEPIPVDEGSIYMFDGEVNRSYLTVSSVGITNGEIIDTKTALGGGTTLYANTKGFYVTAETCSFSYFADDMGVNYNNKTRIIRFEINDGNITAMAEGYVEGTALNQFSMDEYKDHFRIVTTGYGDDYNTTNSVYVLDKELKIVGKITDIAKGERVYSVRFMGDTGYFVTFRQVDPLFAVDLSNPKKPKILSALKIPGFSNYMHPWGDGRLLGIGADADEKTGATSGIKLSMFDISEPESVSEINKKIINNNDSTVGTNHKAILADFNKNLIGFGSVDGKYYIFSYSSENGFSQEAALEIPQDLSSEVYYGAYYYAQNTRGIYIGDYFYLCSQEGISAYKLSDFSKTDSLIF